MDIDAITTRGPDLSDTQKHKYQAANKCFYCAKVGHRAKDCRKKQADQYQNTGRATVTNTEDNKPPYEPFEMSADNIANFLKNDKVDPDLKLKIVKQVLPMGFPMGPN